jgi:hypothetical protein
MRHSQWVEWVAVCDLESLLCALAEPITEMPQLTRIEFPAPDPSTSPPELDECRTVDDELARAVPTSAKKHHGFPQSQTMHRFRATAAAASVVHTSRLNRGRQSFQISFFIAFCFFFHLLLISILKSFSISVCVSECECLLIRPL